MLSLLGVGQGLVHDADRDLDSGGDGADGFAAFAAGQDGGALVVVDHGAAAADAAAFAGRFACAARIIDWAADLRLPPAAGAR